MLLVAPVIYLIVAYVIRIAPKSSGEIDMMFYILLIVAVIQPAMASFMVKSQIKSYRASKYSRMSPGQLFTSVNLIKFAVVEAVYIYGLVVYLLSGDMTRMLYFYLIGIIWSAVYWPRHSTWEKFNRAVEIS